MSEIRNQCQGRWPELVQRFEVITDGKLLRGKHGPCPLCGGNDRFRFDDKQGCGSWICTHCGAGDGLSLLMKYKGWEFAEMAKELEKVVGSISRNQPAKQKSDPRPKLLQIGKGLQLLTGSDPASMYLRNRGISILAREWLRFHPGVNYYHDGKSVGTFPAMVARISDKDNRSESYHITHLTSDGRKAPVPAVKKVMTPINSISGCAIRLSGPEKHIGLCEGIENALAATEMEGIPCWAAVSAGGLEAFEPYAGLEKVTIYADNDFTYTGHKAAYTLAHRLTVKHSIDVEVVLRGQPGDDYLDYFLSVRRSAA